MVNKPKLTISYALSLPHGTNPPSSLAPSSEHTFSIENGKVAFNNREYYEALRKAIAAAKDKIGDDLTAWRDAVGNAELGKEKAVKGAREDDEEDEVDDDR